MKNELTLGSLFDGSGGFPLGGMLAGITPLWASEIEPFAVRVTTKRLPQMKHYGDVSSLNGADLPPVDIITFGSPCQDMSIAGKRSGLDGSRSSLFYEAVRIIKEMRCATDGRYPRFAVWENVPGAFSSNKGEDFRCVLESLCRVRDESVFASKLICGDCGGFYGQKVWHSNDAYRKVILRCNAKFKGTIKCRTPTLSTEIIKEKYLAALNRLIGSRQQIIESCKEMCSIVADCTELNAEIDSLNEEINVISEMVGQCIKNNASMKQSQEEYSNRYNRLVKRYEQVTEQLNNATADRNTRIQKRREINIFIDSLKKQPLAIETWDDELWILFLDTATVHSDGRITFRFKNGTEINQ